MIKNYSGFTLIETLVAVAVLGVLVVTVGGIMTMSFKVKNSTGNNELMSRQATNALGELKKNILDAEYGKINCPVGVGSSISFETKNGGMTTLLCNEIGHQIASASAVGTSTSYFYLSGSVWAINCQNFVSCNLTGGSDVNFVDFKLNLQVGGTGTLGTTGVFYGTVAPRE